MKKLVIYISILFSISASGQQKKIKTLEISDTIVFAAVDRPGDFYLVTKEGQIQKFDPNGKLIIVYKHKGVPTLFDPRDGARLFAYYRENQHYEYLNPSFEVTASFRIDSAFAIDPWLITTSGDHKLWVLDVADHSLKKINVKESHVEVEVTIDASLIEDASSFTFMREYQGFVFLLNPKRGIYIFNSLGRHIKIIPAEGVHHFNFLGEELYFMQDGKLKYVDLFSAEDRELPLEKPSRMVLLTDTRMLLIQYRSLDLFEFKP